MTKHQVLLVASNLLAVACQSHHHEFNGHANNEALHNKSPYSLSINEVVELRKIASSGDSGALYLLSVYEKTIARNDKESHLLLKAAAEAGSPAAQCSYYSFLVQTGDYNTRHGAVVWLRKAAVKNYAPAHDMIELDADVMKIMDDAKNDKPIK